MGHKKKLDDLSREEGKEFMEACIVALDAVAGYREIETPKFIVLAYHQPEYGKAVSSCHDPDEIIRVLFEQIERMTAIKRERKAMAEATTRIDSLTPAAEPFRTPVDFGDPANPRHVPQEAAPDTPQPPPSQ